MVDTNVILRYIVGDGGDHADKARLLFQNAAEGKIILVIPEIVFMEIVHVLRSHYKHDRADICKALRLLLRLPGVENMTPVSTLKRSLDNYEATNAPWPDALIAAHALEVDMPEIYSFDPHIGKFAGITKISP
jgi:predicted nucleic acid-binding protein